LGERNRPVRGRGLRGCEEWVVALHEHELPVDSNGSPEEVDPVDGQAQRLSLADP
jgi:hypothetical protein